MTTKTQKKEEKDAMKGGAKNSVRAITRKARISPMKIRPLVRSIMGKPAMQALDILSFVPNKSAKIVLKTLKSAIANAENNHNMSSANLFVEEAHVDDAPVLKRFLPVARGSAHPIRKRSSHVRIVLSTNAPNKKSKIKAKKAGKKAAMKGAAE